MNDPDNSYDESTNPSNGWREPEDFDLHDLEPGEDNPLDSDPGYNPLNHAYPMIADTTIGQVEIMVKFSIIRGKENLPIDLINNAEALQVPMSIEDVPISDEGKTFEIPDDLFADGGMVTEQAPNDAIAESALISELTEDETYYLIPMIVRARRLDGDLLSSEETANLISPSDLLALIIGYRDTVAADPMAPKALLDLLDHFVKRDPEEFEDLPDNL
jgi:hypothetical protein